MTATATIVVVASNFRGDKRRCACLTESSDYLNDSNEANEWMRASAGHNSARRSATFGAIVNHSTIFYLPSAECVSPSCHSLTRCTHFPRIANVRFSNETTSESSCIIYYCLLCFGAYVCACVLLGFLSSFSLRVHSQFAPSHEARCCNQRPNHLLLRAFSRNSIVSILLLLAECRLRESLCCSRAASEINKRSTNANEDAEGSCVQLGGNQHKFVLG